MSPSSHPSNTSFLFKAVCTTAEGGRYQPSCVTGIAGGWPPGEWGLAAEGISERWIGWTRLAAVGFNAKSCGSKKKVLN